MKFTTSTIIAALTAGVLADKAGRTFAVMHFYGQGPLTMGRADPIIDPGKASGHVHAIQGGNAFALSMSDSTPATSTCTSTYLKNDKSNYWTPSVYFRHANGSFESVDLFYMNVYYFFEATDDTITAFQPGHRMVVGNPNLRTPPSIGGGSNVDLANGPAQPIQFTCPRTSYNPPSYPADSDGLHGYGMQDPGNAGTGAGFPDANCDGYASPLRADIHFPSCYNPAAGLDNYASNMQFPSSKGASAGGRTNCPEGWIHTPHLFYEVYWNTPKFADLWTPGQGQQPFVLSNGDSTGYGLHGDFISGWDVETLQTIIDTCDAGDSGMDKCPQIIGGVNNAGNSCNIPNPFPETIFGMMDALPGNNPVVGFGGTVAGAPAATSVASAPTAAAQSVAPAKTSTAAQSSSTFVGSGSGKVASIISSAVAAASSALASTPVATTTPSTVVSSPEAGSTWTSKGCYLDVTTARVLTGEQFVNIGQGEVTMVKCVAACDSAGFTLAGTEYGGQCFCGNELSGSSLLDSAHCNMPCEGDKTQTCGGNWALSIMEKNGSSDAGLKARRRRHNHMERHARGVSA